MNIGCPIDHVKIAKKPQDEKMHPIPLRIPNPRKIKTLGDPRFLEAVKEFWDELLPRVKHHLHTNGGPIIMVQIENEYGQFGDVVKVSESLIFIAHKSRINNYLLT